MSLRKMRCCVLALILALPLAAPINTYAASKFSDTSGHWAENYINTAVNQKIITGYSDGRFLPDKAVTRAEFATMVNKALGNTGAANLTFSDVSYGEWYYNDVAKAVAAAYTAGYDDNTFRPNSPITRQEAAVMISRFVPTYGSGGNLRAYSDYRSIADWAYDAVEKINGKGYLGAYSDEKIHPTDHLTRAQTAKILCDIVDNETIVTSSPTIDDDGTKLSGKIYANNITIDEDLGEDSATIDNCVILGNLSVKGGGTGTITISNSRVASATVNKDDNPVRILAKGETAIAKLSASQSSVLQTSGLSGGLFGSGFSNVNIDSSADVTLRGSFPRVNVNGTRSQVTLDSGSIETLTVGGRYSDITADSGTTISTATVNVESYFHGSGTISKMYVNADDVTYETKPKSWTIASNADTPKEGDGASDITFNPRYGATNIKLDAKIIITFGSSMEMDGGDSITSSNIDDFVELRKGSSSGSKVSYSATINSSKTIITITPNDDLDEDTKYYIVIDEDSIQDDDGNGNEAQSVYFTTGDDTGSVTTAFSPANGATAVPVNTNITITFSDDVVKYSGGGTISTSDSYLEDCIVFKKTNSSGSNVSCNVTINSSKKVITIDPDSNLTLDQKYYVAVVGNKLKTKDGGEVIASGSVTWTVGETTPVVNTLTLTPGETTITASLTSNVAGTAYLVALPSVETAPSAAQVVAGQNSSGVSVDTGSKTNGSISANTSKSFSFIGLVSNADYKVYAVVRANNVNSAVKNTATKTIRPVTKLADLGAVVNVEGNSENLISFSSSMTTYNITLNTSITTLIVNASGSGDISIDGDTPVADNASKAINLSGTDQTISVTIEKDNTDTTTYEIVVSRDNNIEISSLQVTADGQTLDDSGGGIYKLTTTAAIEVTVKVTGEDEFAAILLEGEESGEIGERTFSIDLPADTEEDFTFKIVSGNNSADYTITLKRPSP